MRLRPFRTEDEVAALGGDDALKHDNFGVLCGYSEWLDRRPVCVPEG